MKQNNKQKTINTHKRIKNLRKFDIGTSPIDRGYQTNNQFVPLGFNNQNQVDMSSSVSAARQQNTANLVNNLATTGASIYSLADIGFKNVAAQAAGKAGKQFLGTSTAGAALAGIGAAYNGFNLTNEFINRNTFQGIGGQELNNMAAKNTAFAGNVAYENIGGVDEQGIMDYARLNDKKSQQSMITSGMGLGASIGTFLGPVGTLVGGGIGALLGGIFGNSHKQRAMQRRMLNNFYTASNATNKQNESVAMSQNMRNEFLNGADKGKASGVTFNSFGTNENEPNGLAGKGESIWDPSTGMGTYIDEGTKRVDNVPVNVKDRDVIFGNLPVFNTGKSFAELAEPRIKYIEQFNKLRRTDNSKTAQIQNRELDKLLTPVNIELSNLAKLQEQAQIENDMQKYKCGKSAKYDNGYSGLISTIPGLIASGVGLNQYYDYKKEQPYAVNTYVPNVNANDALNILGNLRVNPYSQIQAVNDSARHGIYGINHSTLNAGQKAAAFLSMINNANKQKSDIYFNTQNANNQYKQAYASTKLQAGETDAQRRQQALAMQADNYAKAIAARRRGMEQGQANMLSGINTIFGNYLNNYWQKKLINLYDADISKNSKQNYSTYLDNLLKMHNDRVAKDFVLPKLITPQIV